MTRNIALKECSSYPTLRSKALDDEVDSLVNIVGPDVGQVIVCALSLGVTNLGQLKLVGKHGKGPDFCQSTGNETKLSPYRITVCANLHHLVVQTNRKSAEDVS